MPSTQPEFITIYIKPVFKAVFLVCISKIEDIVNNYRIIGNWSAFKSIFLCLLMVATSKLYICKVSYLLCVLLHISGNVL